MCKMTNKLTVAGFRCTIFGFKVLDGFQTVELKQLKIKQELEMKKKKTDHMKEDYK